MNIIRIIVAMSVFYSIIFQGIFGLLSISQKIKISFINVCFISITSQIAFSILVFSMNYYDLSNSSRKCLNPILPIITVIFICIVILIIIILFQSIINYFLKKNVNKK